MKRVFLYARVSTEEQAVHGLSIDAQLSALEEWAKTNGHEIVGTYIDAGISARKPATKRPALQRLLSDVKDGMGDLVIFTKLDRWVRNVAWYYKIQEILEKHHVNWRTIQEDYDTSTASGRLKINIMLSVAQDEADRTGERIKFIFEDKVQRGEVISGKVPLGYKIEEKKMVVNPETAPIAQDIFRQYTTLKSVAGVRKYMVDKYGILYAYQTIRYLLVNERYIGRAHGHDDFCPPLIELDQFNLVQQIIKERAERNAARANRVYLFSGLARCAECGNKLGAHTVGGEYIYYRCTRSEKYHSCPHKKRTSELVLEQWLLENLVSSYEEYNISVQEKAKIEQPKIDEGKIKRKMDKLKDLYLNDLIDRETYERDYTQLRDELRTAHWKTAQLPKVVNTKGIDDVLKAYEWLTRRERKEFWNRIVGEIKITNDDHFFVSPIRHN